MPEPAPPYPSSPAYLSGPSCPVDILAHQTLATVRSLTRLLRMLHLSMTNCCTCSSRASCPIPGDFNAQLALALQEITDKWHLS